MNLNFNSNIEGKSKLNIKQKFINTILTTAIIFNSTAVTSFATDKSSETDGIYCSSPSFNLDTSSTHEEQFSGCRTPVADDTYDNDFSNLPPYHYGFSAYRPITAIAPSCDYDNHNQNESNMKTPEPEPGPGSARLPQDYINSSRVRQVGGSHRAVEGAIADSDYYTYYYIIPWYSFVSLRDEILLNKKCLLDESTNDDRELREIEDAAPAIMVSKEDHEVLFNRQDENTYEFTQGLIRVGNLQAMLDKELDYISRTFPGKYEGAIEQVRQYIASFEIEDATDDRSLSFKNPFGEGRVYYNPNLSFGGSYEDASDILDFVKSVDYCKADKYKIYEILPYSVLSSLVEKIINERNLDESIYSGLFKDLYSKKFRRAPSIIVSQNDYYMLTNSRRQDYVETANELIRDGNLQALFDRELDYISMMCKNRYDDAIEQVREYIKEFDIQDATDENLLSFKNPYTNCGRVYYRQNETDVDVEIKLGGSYDKVMNSAEFVNFQNTAEKCEQRVYSIIDYAILKGLGLAILEGRTDINPNVYLSSFEMSDVWEYKLAPAIMVNEEDYQKLIDRSEQLRDLFGEDLLEHGNLKNLINRELDSISDMLDNKYEEAIAQVRAYIDTLQIEDAACDRPLSFINPYNGRRVFYQPRRN